MQLGRIYSVGLVAFIVAGVTVFAVWGVWDKVKQGRVQQQVQTLIDQYKAAGEPILPEDFDTVPIPNSTNAVVDLRTAVKAMPTTRRADKIESIRIEIQEENRPISNNESRRLQELLKTCDQTLVDIRAAVAKPNADWGIKYRTPVWATMYADLPDVHALAHLLDADAVVAHYCGDHAHALESLRQAILLGRIVARQRNLLAGMVAWHPSDVASEEIEAMAPTLRIGSGKTDATPAQVQVLIAELLRDSDARRAMHDCLLGERMMELDACRNFAPGTNQPFTDGGYVSKRMAMQDAVMLMQWTTKLVYALDFPDYPTAKAAIPYDPSRSRSFVADSLICALMRSEVTVRTAFRCTTDARLAAVVLAARWYAAEHNGNLPATLQDLVPNYLPEIPLDPMAAGKSLGYVTPKDRATLDRLAAEAATQPDNQPGGPGPIGGPAIRAAATQPSDLLGGPWGPPGYVPSSVPSGYTINKDRTVVYSVGESGVDEQGNEAPMYSKTSKGGPRSWNARNYVVYLDKSQ